MAAFVGRGLTSFAAVAAGVSKTCSSPQLSCQNTTAVADLCCFNAPGGQLLQTQFWDTSPSTGPSDSWTIHGLWPDHCDGTYDSSCDSSQNYGSIQTILDSFGATDLLSYMNTYWVDIDGDNDSFWEHEWEKHGTCIPTLKPSCYSSYVAMQEVVDFFQKTVDLFETLPTYTWLANAGITPSSTNTYTSAAIQAALEAGFGQTVSLGCDSGALTEVWYSYNVQGSIQDGTFVPVVPVGTTQSCATTGIKYLPKSGTTASTTSSPSSTPTAPAGSFAGSGYLNAYVGSAVDGCLISAGTWYSTGTCATYTATTSGSGFTLTSSKGQCGISSGTFVCASGTAATVFTAVDGKLAYSEATTFYAAAAPVGTTQQTVYTTSNSVAVTFGWQSV
ncbi:ribonuclease-like protein T2 [Calycina marina]|uniref:Ribonuclease T2-like n=1 Tax=Calycina marina TaxID=1763456 RepID=A0A9P7ZC33_9HELO|nr:ribonuclease-like protein T2 [Calycina marina]